MYQGDQKTRRELLKSQQFNVLITTYEMIMNDRPFLSKLKWMHLIVDEGMALALYDPEWAHGCERLDPTRTRPRSSNALS